MSDKSSIEWTDATWNPTVGCTKVSPGCDNCYAEGVVTRWHTAGSLAFPTPFDTVHVRNEKQMRKPLHWTKPRRIFVNSLSDLFHVDVPDETIARTFAVMALAGQHTFQLLTKRHGRMRALLGSREFVALVDDHREDLLPRCGDFTWPLPNVWLGVSTEDQHWADIRIPALLDTPAAVRWISAEPLLGPTSVVRYLMDWPETGGTWQRGLDWVVAGGESGTLARSAEPDWFRSLRDECAKTNVPFLFKQWGGPTSKAGGRDLDGRTHDDYPAELVRA